MVKFLEYEQNKDKKKTINSAPLRLKSNISYRKTVPCNL